MSEIMVELINVSKFFGKIQAAKNLSLKIKEGELFFLVGPSGCGKTTTMRMIAGFETANSGLIKVQGETINRVPPERRNIGMVFQSWALFPHKSVFDNIAFGLRMKKLQKEIIREKVKEALSLIRMPEFGDRYPDQLSGGQKQRVALARALAIEPRVLLLDEPLSNLDAKIREEMRIEITTILKRLNITCIYVTHDQSEALVMSDRIAIMELGEIKQVASAVEIYEKPENEFVAKFIGETNIFIGKITQVSGPMAIFVSDDGLELKVVPSEKFKGAHRYKVFVRPEKIYISSGKIRGTNCYQCNIKRILYMGATIRYIVELPNGYLLRIDEQNTSQAPNFKMDDLAYISIAPKNCRIFQCFD